MPDSRLIPVAIAVVRRGDSVLVSRRPRGVHQGGLCEFPGGKVEPGESSAQAVARELAEETGLTARDTRPLIRFNWDYGDRRLHFDVFTVRSFDGDVRGDARWVPTDALRAADFPPASRVIINALRLPDHYLITPAVGDRRHFIRCFRRALQNGVRLAVLRDERLDDAACAEVAREMTDEAAAFGAKVLLHNRGVNAGGAGVGGVGAGVDDGGGVGSDGGIDDGSGGAGNKTALAGVHLSAAALLQCRNRPVPADCWFAASCHNARELQAAVAVGADFVVLGPVRATPSHAGAAPLGWPAFAALIADLPLPVYALGGMEPRDVVLCRRHGGHGIAAIRGLWHAA
ncbi:MAG: thiamine phosphate synthase [Gammaproteobacteria bacterium]|nr:thiamine phosphate synthase [Gammaproteobacteria bacterium]